MGNVGIIGRARVGKDAAGQWLVDNRGYRRIGFADPLKEAALKLDPLIEQIDMVYLAVGRAS
ncbi:Adenylate kinase OS=Streptomyces microflavus OX=1919 GN=Smic_81130 PE=4 SV=1 [Streptomyces microflavus]